MHTNLHRHRSLEKEENIPIDIEVRADVQTPSYSFTKASSSISKKSLFHRGELRPSIPEACILAETGDLVLFSGTGVFSTMLEMVCGSPWSHVAIVIKQTGYEPLLVESVWAQRTDKLKDRIQNPNLAKEGGIRVVNMHQALTEYPSRMILLRKLQCKTVAQRDALALYLSGAISDAVDRYRSSTYNYNWFSLISARYRLFGGTARPAISVTTGKSSGIFSCWSQPERPRSFFCSELVAQLFIDVGLMVCENDDDTSLSAGQFLPGDFSGSYLRLMSPNDRFGEEIRLGVGFLVERDMQ